MQNYGEDILKTLFSAQDAYSPTLFIDRHPELGLEDRAYLAGEIARMCEQHAVDVRVYFLAVRIADRFFSLSHDFEVGMLAFLAHTCFWIASKYEEDTPVDLKNIESIVMRRTDERAFASMERHILKTIDYDLNFSLVSDFTETWTEFCAKSIGIVDKRRFNNLCVYFAMMASLDYNISSCNVSHVAAACFYCAIFLTFGFPKWNGRLSHYTQTVPESFQYIVHSIQRARASVENTPGNLLETVLR